MLAAAEDWEPWSGFAVASGWGLIRQRGIYLVIGGFFIV